MDSLKKAKKKLGSALIETSIGASLQKAQIKGAQKITQIVDRKVRGIEFGDRYESAMERYRVLHGGQAALIGVAKKFSEAAKVYHETCLELNAHLTAAIMSTSSPHCREEYEVFRDLRERVVDAQRTSITTYYPPFLEALTELAGSAPANASAPYLEDLKKIKNTCKAAMLDKNKHLTQVTALQNQEKSPTNMSKLRQATKEYQFSEAEYKKAELLFEHGLEDYEAYKTFTMLRHLCNLLSGNLNETKIIANIFEPMDDYIQSDMPQAVYKQQEAFLAASASRKAEVQRMLGFSAASDHVLEAPGKGFDVAPPEPLLLAGEEIWLTVENVIDLSGQDSIVTGVMHLTSYRLVVRPYLDQSGKPPMKNGIELGAMELPWRAMSRVENIGGPKALICFWSSVLDEWTFSFSRSTTEFDLIADGFAKGQARDRFAFSHDVEPQMREDYKSTGAKPPRPISNPPTPSTTPHHRPSPSLDSSSPRPAGRIVPGPPSSPPNLNGSATFSKFSTTRESVNSPPLPPRFATLVPSKSQAAILEGWQACSCGRVFDGPTERFCTECGKAQPKLEALNIVPKSDETPPSTPRYLEAKESPRPPRPSGSLSLSFSGGWAVYDEAEEYKRLGITDSSSWRLSSFNAGYSVCETYPQIVVVPKQLLDKRITELAKFRTKKRVPVLIWKSPGVQCIFRSSQPKPGISQARNEHDEYMLRMLGECGSEVTAVADLPRGRDRSEMALLARKDRFKGEAYASGTLEGLQSHVRPDTTLVVFDARPQKNAIGNVAKGGGWELQDHYPNTILAFLDIENIHEVRQSLSLIRNAFALMAAMPKGLPVPPPIPPLSDFVSASTPVTEFKGFVRAQESYFRSLESNARYAFSKKQYRWFAHLASILRGANLVVESICTLKKSALVHCSDGWDRTPQLTATAQLLMDPYYRSLEGFIVLVEKDWLAFGHKFEQRSGTGDGRDPKDSQRSPIFLQWIDCVFQLTRQFASSFEFNSLFLADLIENLYSCRFGTFCGNNHQERSRGNLRAKTPSFWSFVLSSRVRPVYTNPDFVAAQREKTVTPLRPVAEMEKMVLFMPFYLRWDRDVARPFSLGNVPAVM